MAISHSESTQTPRLLIANRGEIALRILRAARDEGWKTIAVYSEADATASHVAMADEAYPIGPSPSHESYLKVEAILEAARLGRATHLHPGYGFLAENGDFAQACTDAGLDLIGPTAEAIHAMGNKVAARETAKGSGVPLIPGCPPLTDDPEMALAEAETIGYPVLCKAAMGGGGKGMRVCHDPEELLQALQLTRGEAGRAFGDDTIYLERALVNPRHVEIQILCDHHGNGVYLGERECSIQRRHQKLVEETPCTVIDETTRERMGKDAVGLALAIGYRNAGTVEFLLDNDGSYYFLEMNTRLQVEHPITELTTGIDIVRQQLRIALGEPLPWTQDEIQRTGASIECRIIAEDPFANFLPVSGRVLWARLPEGPGVRNDIGFETGTEVTVFYDSLLGKLITYGRDREEARLRMLRALDEYLIEGVRTNLPFLRWTLDHPAFIEGRTHTGFIEEHFDPAQITDHTLSEDLAIAAAVGAFRERTRPGGQFTGRDSAGGDGSGRDGDPSSGFAPGSAPSADPNAPRISSWKRPHNWSRTRN